MEEERDECWKGGWWRPHSCGVGVGVREAWRHVVENGKVCLSRSFFFLSFLVGVEFVFGEYDGLMDTGDWYHGEGNKENSD